MHLWEAIFPGSAASEGRKPLQPLWSWDQLRFRALGSGAAAKMLGFLSLPDQHFSENDVKIFKINLTSY